VCVGVCVCARARVCVCVCVRVRICFNASVGISGSEAISTWLN
jgi:hypothetical protein